MPLVYGNLRTFGLQSLDGFFPEIYFIPSEPAVAGSELFATKRVKAVYAAGGGFEVELQSTENATPAFFYRIRIEWLNGAGIATGLDLPDWKLYVPVGGGILADLVAAPSNPGQVWVGENPPNPPVTPGTWWLIPSTGDLYEWEN